MEVVGDEIADLILENFDKLPKKRKPQLRGDGSHEWTPLCGIVAQDKHGLVCIAIGTGMKCLPSCKVSSANGAVLHDWHAEVVCLRALNRFLLEECLRLLVQGLESRYISYYTVRDKAHADTNACRLFKIRDGVKFHMYCSEAPCGDASMELIMAAQEDAAPWTRQNPKKLNALQGRGHFSRLGIVRRKPSRPDALPSLSKSCTDKIALVQALSFLSSVSSTMIDSTGAYLSSLTLPDSQYRVEAIDRAFSSTGRLVSLCETWSHEADDYRFHPFCIKTTSREFRFSRRTMTDNKIIASNVACIWSPYFEETLIGGFLQGRKSGDYLGACRVSRRRMAAIVVQLAGSALELYKAGDLTLSVTISEGLQQVMDAQHYSSLKSIDMLASRRRAKYDILNVALQGWVKNTIDDFNLVQSRME